MRQTKSCGCLISTAVINLEVSKRKITLKLEKINKKLKIVKNPKKIVKLKVEKRNLTKILKDTIKHKQKTKSQFDEHIKKSGYVPPKFKGA